jgi:hypothetical protein
MVKAKPRPCILQVLNEACMVSDRKNISLRVEHFMGTASARIIPETDDSLRLQTGYESPRPRQRRTPVRMDGVA